MLLPPQAQLRCLNLLHLRHQTLLVPYCRQSQQDSLGSHECLLCPQPIIVTSTRPPLLAPLPSCSHAETLEVILGASVSSSSHPFIHSLCKHLASTYEKQGDGAGFILTNKTGMIPALMQLTI